MGKYKIRREFFPFSHFTPPISEKFLAMTVPHMKTHKFIYKDKALDVTRHEIESYDAEMIECFLMSPKAMTENAPCLIYIHGGGFCLQQQDITIKTPCDMSRKSDARWSSSIIGWHRKIPIRCSLRTAMPLCAGHMTTQKSLVLILPEWASAATAPAPHLRLVYV